jgi:hypothetical protein|tara:strand:+ start:3010 stop:3423 length:414 start_codon:yes stop_codon:yes gene_type:complete
MKHQKKFDGAIRTAVFAFLEDDQFRTVGDHPTIHFHSNREGDALVTGPKAWIEAKIAIPSNIRHLIRLQAEFATKEMARKVTDPIEAVAATFYTLIVRLLALEGVDIKRFMTRKLTKDVMVLVASVRDQIDEDEGGF